MPHPDNRWAGTPVNQPNDEGCHLCHYWYTIGTEGCWDCRGHDCWQPMTEHDKQPHCHGCHHTPDELVEFADIADPNEFIKQDPLYDPDTNMFWCSSCYTKIALPFGLVE